MLLKDFGIKALFLTNSAFWFTLENWTDSTENFAFKHTLTKTPFFYLLVIANVY
jgi:hypothetical protein